MLYDWTGKAIEEAPKDKAAEHVGRRLTSWENTDRYETDASRALDPEGLDLIFRSANTGDPESQARLALEIEEKDPDIAHPLQTRRSGVLACEWGCEPATATDAAGQKIADAAEAMLRAINPRTVGPGLPPDAEDVDFDGCLQHMLSGILPGYAWLEILWEGDGSAVRGFAPGPAPAITFNQSKAPLIKTTLNPLGAALAPNKFVFHRHRSRSGDATRGGIVRPLGWMFLFGNLGVKNLLRFVEKFGMPFVSARLDDDAWETDRSKIAYLIKNFGSDGGGVFSKAVELNFLEANTQGGDIYFKLIEHFGKAKEKVILGQIATSAEASGMSNGQAQERVRFDILQADCRALETTVRNDILAPWTSWNFGPTAPVPAFKIRCRPAEDLKQQSEIVGNLVNAGYQVDAAFIEKKFGMPITKDAAGKPMVTPRQTPGLGFRGLAARALSDAKAETSAEANAKLAQNTLAGIRADAALREKWLRPVDDAIKAALAGMPDEPDEADMALFNSRLKTLLKKIPGLFGEMDTAALEEYLADAMYSAHCNGRLGRAGQITRRLNTQGDRR